MSVSKWEWERECECACEYEYEYECECVYCFLPAVAPVMGVVYRPVEVPGKAVKPGNSDTHPKAHSKNKIND